MTLFYPVLIGIALDGIQTTMNTCHCTIDLRLYQAKSLLHLHKHRPSPPASVHPQVQSDRRPCILPDLAAAAAEEEQEQAEAEAEAHQGQAREITLIGTISTSVHSPVPTYLPYQTTVSACSTCPVISVPVSVSVMTIPMPSHPTIHHTTTPPTPHSSLQCRPIQPLQQRRHLISIHRYCKLRLAHCCNHLLRRKCF